MLGVADAEYALHAWVVMPNHVHILMTPLKNVSLIMQRLKGVTAREANQLLCRSGTPFWQHESYDRLVRDAQEFSRIEKYLIWNPVSAGLCTSPECFSVVQRMGAASLSLPHLKSAKCEIRWGELVRTSGGRRSVPGAGQRSGCWSRLELDTTGWEPGRHWYGLRRRRNQPRHR